MNGRKHYINYPSFDSIVSFSDNCNKNGRIFPEATRSAAEPRSRIPVLSHRSQQVKAKMAENVVPSKRAPRGAIVSRSKDWTLGNTPSSMQRNSDTKPLLTGSVDYADACARRPRREKITPRNHIKENITRVTNGTKTSGNPAMRHMSTSRDDTSDAAQNTTKSDPAMLPIVVYDDVLKGNLEDGVTLIVKVDQNIQEEVPEVVVSTRNGAMLRRPASLSMDTRSIVHRSLLEVDASETLDDGNRDNYSIIQDVSSLKLMLLQLKRYLDQNGDDRLLDITNECLSRLTSRAPSDIKSLSREELEQKYALLLHQRANLEQQLQSREQVICRLQEEKDRY